MKLAALDPRLDFDMDRLSMEEVKLNFRTPKNWLNLRLIGDLIRVKGRHAYSITDLCYKNLCNEVSCSRHQFSSSRCTS